MDREKKIKDKSKSQGHRLLRVGENVRHAIATVLSRGMVRDPVLEKAVISVSEVRISPDLRHAAVYIMPLGGQNRDQILASLKARASAIRGQISPHLAMKYIPRLDFRLDDSFDEASHIEDLLKNPRVLQDLG